MAKKKQDLTPEERLAAALVPEEEWPYALPDGWKWVRLGKIYDVNPKVQADDDLEASFVTMSDISPGIKSQFDFIVRKWGEIKKGHTQFANGDVAFAKISPCFENRKSMILDGLKNGIGAGTTELIVLRNPSIDNKYTFLFISSEEFIRHARNTYKGVVGQQRINLDFVKNYPMPLPPLSEQRRLVARIESLFAKLDAAREKVQSVLDSHETRKAALLHAAFAGKLTAKWREENNKRACYAEEPLKNFVETQYGYTEKSSFDIAGPHYLRITDIQGETVDWNNVPNCSIDETNYQKYSLHPNDIVVARTGATTGKSYMIGEDIDAVFASYLIRVQITNIRLLPKFLYMFFQSQEYWSQIMELSAGIAQPGVNARKIQSMMICVPSLPEQQEIVRILDRLLAREQRARQAAEETLAAIDRMKQSILARAFRGEL
ncbi:MAG: restriction endonuclease subunit S [Selenomonadaceae bacterium]|nr:restriction endonuclease subunit S [Selenomonadaceae bacterium]